MASFLGWELSPLTKHCICCTSAPYPRAFIGRKLLTKGDVHQFSWFFARCQFCWNLAGILQIEHQILGDFESILSRSAVFERNLSAKKPEIRKEVKSKLYNGNQLVIKFIMQVLGYFFLWDWYYLIKTPSTLHRRNLKTEFLLWKRIKCSPSTLRRRNLRTQQSPVAKTLECTLEG